jgi:hypothetical protein
MTDRKQHKTDMKIGSGSTLESVVDTFANRMQRRLRERAARQDNSQKETELRHNRILQAMNMIRKALQETCKISLGNRFTLELEIDDWEGWPRLELALVDSLIPEQRDYALVVSANDRKKNGAVRINLKSGELIGRFELSDPNELNRIPLVLKKSVRSYLDEIAEHVLNPVDPEETLQVQTRQISLEEETPDPHAARLKHADLFMEGFDNADENLVADDSSPNPLLDFEVEDNN